MLEHINENYMHSIVTPTRNRPEALKQNVESCLTQDFQNFASTTEKVSVGIPTYNNPIGLIRTLKQITAQSYKNLEILVSDNASTGELGRQNKKILEDFSKEDKRIKYFIQKENIGASNNFYFLLEQATGSFFMWAADDDYWNCEFIADGITTLLAEKKLAGVFCYSTNIDLTGYAFRFFTYPSFGDTKFKNIFNIVREHEFLGKSHPIYSLFRKKILLDIFDILPADEADHSDVNIVITAQCLGGIRIIPKYMFQKTQPITYSLEKPINLRNATSVPIITNFANKIYVRKLIKTAIRCNAVAPIFLALFIRCGIEIIYRIKKFLYMNFKKVRQYIAKAIGACLVLAFFIKARKSVTVEIMGGLGNQMFQYALGKAIACRFGTRFYIDPANYKNYKFNFLLDKFPNTDYSKFPQGRLFRKGLPIIQKVSKKINMNVFIHYSEPNFSYWPEIKGIHPPAYLSGYWQNEQYFSDIESVIRKDFTFPEFSCRDAENIATKIKASPCPVCVHVRRGDYVEDAIINSVHGTCSPEYYEKAIKIITEKFPKKEMELFIFSDDPEWVRDNFNTLGYPSITVNIPQHKEDPYQDMHLMTLCKHHIIANSSFSWWGAWLSTGNGVVIAPKQWFHDKAMRDYNPSPVLWIKI